MKYISLMVAFLMVIFALPSIPLLFEYFPLLTQNTESNLSAWVLWVFVHAATSIGFLVAAILAYKCHRRWPLAVIIICGYVAIIAVPPFIGMSLNTGLINHVEIVWSHAADKGGSDGFYSFWNLIVMPIAPTLVLPIAVYSWFKLIRI